LRGGKAVGEVGASEAPACRTVLGRRAYAFEICRTPGFAAVGDALRHLVDRGVDPMAHCASSALVARSLRRGRSFLAVSASVAVPSPLVTSSCQERASRSISSVAAFGPLVPAAYVVGASS